MKLTCEDCGADIPAENINISRAVAKCAHCGAISGFADRVSNARAAVERLQVALPPGIEVIDLGGELTLLRRWFSWKYAFLAVFCLFWNGFLVVWYTLALSAEETPVLMLVFPILHVAAGVGLSYYTLAGFLNQTEFRVGQGRLRLRHGPIPWPGARDMDAGKLKQLYCTEEVSRSRNGTTITYMLRANLRDGDSIKLARLDTRDQALFIEQRIEATLGIKDVPVAGEVPR
ncbi:MAG: hypothetical protein KC933_08415 [Myxococcales bacterium]|nr:hypothetical protein [Myxococcales bacterium]MCB9652212.1 hypothetical protein [Deltaproteobacteria bacterium]